MWNDGILEALTHKLSDMAKELGASGSGLVDVKKIPFRREFRTACQQNSCGNFGTNWMCPPDVGEIDEMMERAGGYRHGFVFQTVGALEDSFDIEGMQAAAIRHEAIAGALAQQVEPLLGRSLRLGAGACGLCPRCTRPSGEPCRHPDKATASLEAYGIAVSELAELCGLQYINGKNTVTYFGAFLFG